MQNPKQQWLFDYMDPDFVMTWDDFHSRIWSEVYDHLTFTEQGE